MSKPFLSKVYTEPNSLCSDVTKWKSEGKKVVFTNGCFDILHIGHASYLEEAKQQGDILIVGVNDDESVSRLKGPTRPINSIADRMALLAALESVDAVISFAEDTPYSLISSIIPDVLVKGGDWTADQIVGSDIVHAHGGEVKSLKFVDGKSTTRIVERLKS